MKFRVIAAAAAAALSVPLLAQLPANAQAATSASVMVATGHTKPGLVVDLYAWPSNQVLQHLKAGQLVPTKLIARTTASTTGAYSLTVPRAALKAAATTGGYANLEIDAGSAVWFTTEAAASPAVTTGHLAVATPDRCTGWRWYKKLKPATGTVGQSYVLRSGSGVRQSFTYAVGQSSTLGIGLSGSNKFGSWSAGGTDTVTKDGSASFPSFGVGNIWYQTGFKMGEFRDACAAEARDSHPPEAVAIRYLARAIGWAGGTSVAKPKRAPRASFCRSYLKGSTFSTSNEKAVTWSAGLSVTQIGFGASAQTGYDRSAQVTFVFNRTRLLCGTTDYAPSARQIVART